MGNTGTGPSGGADHAETGVARGPAATVVVDLEGTNGTQLQGSQLVVKGKLEEVRVKESELWGRGDLEVKFKNLDLGKFSFAHDNVSMKPCNMSRWRDGLDMGFEVIKPGGEVVRDSLVIKSMEVGGGSGMSARLVVFPQKVGSAALYLDIAPMKLKDIREVCKIKDVALADPNIHTFCGYIGMDRKERKRAQGREIHWLA